MQPFVAQPVDYSTIYVSWTQPQGDWTDFRLISNRYGFPVDENDGDILIDSDTYPGSGYADLNIIPGTYHYYGIYLQIDVDTWVRSGFTSCLMPGHYGSGQQMFDLMPQYFRELADVELTQDAEGDQYLQQFLNVLGWSWDYLRTQYNVLFQHLNDPMFIPLGDLMNLAAEIGMPWQPEVPAYILRKGVANWTHIAQERGTPGGISEQITLLTGYGVDLQPGTNLMLEQDQSAFTDPVPETWNSNTGYVVNELVSYENYIYKCILVGNLGTAPSGTTSANTYWSVVQNTIDPNDTLANAGTLGGVNTWEAFYPALETGSFTAPAGSLAEVIGIPDPLATSVWRHNGLSVFNKEGSTQTMMLRSVSRLASDIDGSDPNEAPDPLQPVKDGIPIPLINPSLNEWSASIRYGTGDVVLYSGMLFQALRASTNAPPPSPGTALNANPSFEAAVTPWTAQGGATIATSATHALQGTKALIVTPNGTTANPGAVSESVPVTPNAVYTASAWVYCATSTTAAQIIITWFDAFGQQLSTSASADGSSAAAFAEVSVRAAAPASAVSAEVTVQVTGTPAATVVCYWDVAALACGQTPEWELLSTDGRQRMMLSGYVSQALTVGSNETVEVAPFVEWYDSWGNLIVSNGQARTIARVTTPGTAGTPPNLTFDSFTIGIGTSLAGRLTDTADHNWTPETGAFLISGYAGGSAYPSVVGQRSIAVVTGLSGTTGAPIWLGVTMASAAEAGQSAGIAFRLSDISNYFRADWNALYEINAGTKSLVGSYSTAFQQGDRMNIELNGTAITIYRNNVQVYTTTSTFNQTATLHGIIVENT